MHSKCFLTHTHPLYHKRCFDHWQTTVLKNTFSWQRKAPGSVIAFTTVCGAACRVHACTCVRVYVWVPEDNKSHLCAWFPEWPSPSCANRLAKEEKGPALMCCMWRIYWRAETLNKWSRKCIIRTVSPPHPLTPSRYTHTHTLRISFWTQSTSHVQWH